jgi:hypothetical protein
MDRRNPSFEKTNPFSGRCVQGDLTRAIRDEFSFICHGFRSSLFGSNISTRREEVAVFGDWDANRNLKQFEAGEEDGR